MLKMALQQFVCRLTLMTLLLCSDCHPQVTDNSFTTLVANVSPGNSPWLVYFPPDCEGSLITDQWVLTDSSCVNRPNTYPIVIVGLNNRTSISVGISVLLCNTEIKDGKDSGICLVKLSDRVTFSDDIQAISLASNISTFYSGISSWISVNDFTGESLNLTTQREVEASILGNNECNCEQKQIIATEKRMCAIIGGSYPCQVIPGSPLVIREESQWVLAGVAISTSSSCGGPGVFSRVSWYQDWITEIITGTEPTIVTVSSMGSDPDVEFNCSTEIFPTGTPAITDNDIATTQCSSYRVDPTGMETRSYETTTLTAPTATTTDGIPTDGITTDGITSDGIITDGIITDGITTDGSIFSGGNNLIHFTHFFSLSGLVLFLHVLVGGSKM